jgi:hypothetical protein
MEELNEQTVTVIEEWSRDSMVRYIPHADGTRTVLEHIENPSHPFVMFSGPDTFKNRYWTYKATRDKQDYSSQCEQIPEWAYET